MYITAMTVDANGGNSNEQHSAPTLSAIVAALRALDGQHQTLVLLEHDEDHWLAIGGGNEGRYVVTVSEGATFSLATSPDVPEGTISLVVGGQQADRALRETCDLAGVLSATYAYQQNGSLAKNLPWSATSSSS